MFDSGNLDPVGQQYKAEKTHYYGFQHLFLVGATNKRNKRTQSEKRQLRSTTGLLLKVKFVFLFLRIQEVGGDLFHRSNPFFFSLDGDQLGISKTHRLDCSLTAHSLTHSADTYLHQRVREKKEKKLSPQIFKIKSDEFVCLRVHRSVSF